MRLRQSSARQSARGGSTSPGRCRSRRPRARAGSSRLVGPGHARRRSPAPPRAGAELLEHLAVFEHTALERRRVDLVEAQVRPEEGTALSEAAGAGRRRQVLDLRLVGIDAPAGGVGVAPLRADRHLARTSLRRSSQEAEEGLRPPVRAGGVEVPHAAVEGRIEHGVRVALHRVDSRSCREIPAVAEG